MNNLTNTQRKELVSRIYWFKGQLPPKDWQKEWPKIRAALEEEKLNQEWWQSLDNDEEAIEGFCVF